MAEPAPRVRLVTGGSRGIGSAVARQTAHVGWDVGANRRVDAAAAYPGRHAAQAAGRRACVVPTGVADEVAVGAIFRAVTGETDSLTSKEYEYLADVFAALDELLVTAAL